MSTEPIFRISKTASRSTSIAALLASILLAAATASAQTASLAPASAPPPPPPESVAAEVNDHLPEWVRFGGEYRMRFEGATGIKGIEGNDDAFLLSRLRLNMLFKLGDHVRLFVEGQDSQVWGHDANPDPSTLENDLDVRQAYIELRERDKDGWALKLGRQELAYGDQRLVGSLNWSNTARSFDAAKLTYSDARVSVDLFASSVVATADDHFDHHVDGQNFYGAHASAFKLVPKSQLDAYLFWKTAPHVLSEIGLAGDADTVTFGTRLTGKLASRADYTLELAGQTGSFGGDDIRAGAAHARFGYLLATNAVAPKLRLEYDFASGDADPADGRRGTFDQLYPTGHAKYGVVDQVGWKNMHDARVGISATPHPRLTLEADYHSFWLAEKRDGLYDAAGNLVARIPTGAPDSHVAQEADIQATYALSRQVSLGAGYGHWFPGAFWKAATPGASRDFVYSYFTYKF
jgi:hypothetical protein